ncbi:hypothetical protein KJ742_04390 [Patescibacteria group bacterium]|nr:hypothetical protein [Patescibacteria group bacterium]MBU1683157.1 hypothetical protein [Patescibacteria group bacterium]MBU1934520.1 hypothetical protein [Patescibacteria group bacterium]
MSKFLRLILILLIALTTTPFANAHDPVDQPLNIEEVTIYTSGHRVFAEMEVCNTGYERTSFTAQFKNLDLGSFYKRNLMIVDNGCETYDIGFTENFTRSANIDDQIKVSLDNISSDSGDYTDEPDSFFATIEDNNADYNTYEGASDVYEADEWDFIYHETGVRVRVTSYNGDYVMLLVNGIMWGGFEELKIYEGRDKEIIAADGTRLTITHVGRGESRDVSLMIES